MAETEQVQQSAPSQDQLDLNALAQFAFNEQPTTTQQTPQETAPVPTEQAAQQEELVVDAAAYFKENFGVDSPEAIKEQLAELQRLKSAPPQTAQELAFANEQSKKIFDNLKAGKTKEVREYLEAQELLSNSDSMNEEQKLKLFIKMQNPLYDQELVDAKFARDYGFKESDFKDEDGNITDQLAYRLAKIDALQRLKNDTQKADEFFSQYKTKIELPNIQNDPSTVDKDYEDFKASNARSIEVHKTVIAPALTALKDSDVPLNVSINDSNNQMQFDIGITIDPQDFEKARSQALDFLGYVENRFYDQNGNFLPAKLQRAILLDENFDKYAQTIARQAVNAERKRVIEQKTGGSEPKRDYTVEVPNELKELEKMVFYNGKS